MGDLRGVIGSKARRESEADALTPRIGEVNPAEEKSSVLRVANRSEGGEESGEGKEEEEEEAGCERVRACERANVGESVCERVKVRERWIEGENMERV